MTLRLKYLAIGLILAGFGAFGSGCEDDDSDSQPDTSIPAHWKWVLGSDISDWPVTINLKSADVTHKGGRLHWVTVDYDRLQEIPAHKKNPHNVNGSLWLIREYQGQWYIGTIDYLRVGQTSKEFASSPSFLFMPKPGDRVGFMVSTVNRSYYGTVARGVTYRERSNIVWVTW